MPTIDLSSYIQSNGQVTDPVKMTNALSTIQAAVNGLENVNFAGDYSAAVLADTPKGYWKLDESSGTFADSSGNSHTATAVGGIGYSALGIRNTGVTVDGGASAVEVPHHADFNTGDTFTLEGWVRNNASAHTQVIVEKGSTYRLEIDVGNNKLHFWALGQGQMCASNVVVPQDGALHHCVATKTGATVKLYIDGVDQTGAVTNFTIGNSAVGIGLGGAQNADPNLSLNGGIDEMAIYATALSAARVLVHYQVGATPRLDVSKLALPGGTSTWLRADGAWTAAATNTSSSLSRSTAVTVANTVEKTDLFNNLTIPSGTLTANGAIELKIGGSYTNGTASGQTLAFELKLGNQVLWAATGNSIDVGAGPRAFYMFATIKALGSTASQQASGDIWISDDNAPTTGNGFIRNASTNNLGWRGTFTSVKTTVPMTSSQTLALFVTHSTADAALIFKMEFAWITVTN